MRTSYLENLFLEKNLTGSFKVLYRAGLNSQAITLRLCSSLKKGRPATCQKGKTNVLIRKINRECSLKRNYISGNKSLSLSRFPRILLLSGLGLWSGTEFANFMKIRWSRQKKSFFFKRTRGELGTDRRRAHRRLKIKAN